MTQWQLLADDLWGVKKIYAFCSFWCVLLGCG